MIGKGVTQSHHGAAAEPCLHAQFTADFESRRTSGSSTLFTAPVTSVHAGEAGSEPLAAKVGAAMLTSGIGITIAQPSDVLKAGLAWSVSAARCAWCAAGICRAICTPDHVQSCSVMFIMLAAGAVPGAQQHHGRAVVQHSLPRLQDHLPRGGPFSWAVSRVSTARVRCCMQAVSSNLYVLNGDTVDVFAADRFHLPPRFVLVQIRTQLDSEHRHFVDRNRVLRRHQARHPQARL